MRQEINFLAQLPKPKRVLLNLQRMLVALVALTILLVIVSLITYGQYHAARQEITQLRAQQQQQAAALVAYTQAHPDDVHDPRLEQRMLQLAEHIDASTELYELIAEQHGNNLTGFSSYLVAFSQAVPSNLWLTAITIDRGGDAIQLAGQANALEVIPLFADNLMKQTLFADQHFKVAEINKTMTQDAARPVDIHFVIASPEIK